MPVHLPKPFLACTRFLSVVLVLFSAVLTTAAAPSAPVSGPPNSVWKITASGKTKEVCLGDKILFMARWQPNPNYVDPLFSLTGSGSEDDLAPLAGPRKLLAKASLGSFEPGTETPGAAMGVAEFTYKAEKKGSETITFQVFNELLEVDTSVTKTFQVNTCDYKFTLMIKDDFSAMTEDGPYTMYTVTNARGTLKATDPANPDLYEAFDKKIDTVLTVTQIMNCQINTNEPASAFGFVDAKAVKDEEGSITLMIGPPKDYDVVISYTVVCPDGDPFSVGLSKNISGGEDPWIQKEYPLGEGTMAVDSRQLNPAISKMEAAGFTVVSTAWLKLEKVVK
jgi:hypothetical protein